MKEIFLAFNSVFICFISLNVAVGKLALRLALSLKNRVISCKH